jgi:bifunctional oligoribonuclease and PAP phosphatase NrnA
MTKEIFKTIESYQTVIIHRHERPDLDAIGSQVGLKHVLKSVYPNKDIYAVGDINSMSYHAVMDEVSEDIYKDALVIITDVSVAHMVSDQRYTHAKDIIVIDHHQNAPTVEHISLAYIDSSFNSACEMIIDMCMKEEVEIPTLAATYLYGGMVTDSGRFLYLKEGSRTFKLASYVCQFNPDIKDMYDYLYTEDLEKRLIKNTFQTFQTTQHQVAYRINSQTLIKSTGLEFQAISRGMVNLMSGIKEIRIWVSFSEDENGAYVCEMRSRHIEIVDIAKAFGGGGHAHACGATLNNLEDVHKMLDMLDERNKQ